MYLAALTNENRVLVVFDSERHVDEGLELLEMPEEVFQQIMQTGRFGDWVYQNGQYINDPEPVVTPENQPTPPSGNIPASVL